MGHAESGPLAVLLDSVMITAAVAAMMIAVEYINVRTHSRWLRTLAARPFLQYLLAVALAAIPGCLGGYTLVALYSHRLIGLGAVVAGMFVAIGDEAFVMLALFPRTTVLLVGALAGLGLVVGALADLVLRRVAPPTDPAFHPLPLHEECCDPTEAHEPGGERRHQHAPAPDRGHHHERLAPHSLTASNPTDNAPAPAAVHLTDQPPVGATTRAQGTPRGWHAALGAWLSDLSLARGTLLVSLVVAVLALGAHLAEHEHVDWGGLTMIAVALFALFVVATVPEHFLQEHLWEHVAKKHLPRLFGWTLAALSAVALLGVLVDLRGLVSANVWPVLGAAGLVGLIPQSGPHLLFVSLYAEGAAPLGVLVASAIVQDGHGSLPLLAHSRRDFAIVKGINLALGLALGSAVILLAG